MNILMIVTGDWHYDPRVLQERKALTQVGHSVSVVDWKEKPENKIKWFISLWFWYYREYRLNKHIGFDVVHCHDFDTLPVGVMVKKLFDCTLVYDAHDVFEHLPGLSSMMRMGIGFGDRRLLPYADQVITAHQPTVAYYQSRTNVPVCGLVNCVNPLVDSYVPPVDDGVFRLCYFGLMTKSRWFPRIVDVVGDMPGVELVLGSRNEGLYKEVKEACKKYQNTHFLGQLSVDELLSKMLRCDATFALADLDVVPHNHNVYGKQFQAMACGRPIICTRNTWSGDFTIQNEVGITVEDTFLGIKKGVEMLRDDPYLCQSLGKNALRLCQNRFNWDMEKQRLLDVYRQVYYEKGGST